MRNQAELKIHLGSKGFLDSSCLPFPLDKVSPIDKQFANIKERLDDNGDWVVDATYDCCGGENVRWRYGKNKQLKAFYIYKTEQKKAIDAAEGLFCPWQEAYIK